MTSTPSTIADRVVATSATMSRTQRRMADYVLSHQFKVATMTIDEFARAADVSIATANRFARHLGLQGYPQFRSELARGFQAALAPIEKLRSELAQPTSVAEVFTASLQEDIHNFQATQATLSAAQCERAVDLILSSDRVFTLGFGGSGYLASLLQRGLSTSCDYVESLASAGGASHAARRLSRVSSRDLVIAITFPRYVRDTVLLARAAKKMGSSLIVLTDRPTSPLAPDATVVLYVSSERQYSAISETAVLGFIEALCAATAYKAKNSLESAAKLAESVMPWLIFGEDSHG